MTNKVFMHRRAFIATLGVSVLGLCLPTTASPPKHCRIIGIGGAGCNFLYACQSTDILPPASGWTTELIGMKAKHETVNEFIATFSAWLFDADVVVLVAGLGGETSSSLMPVMARLTRAAGAFTTAAAIMPFDFEGAWRTRISVSALRQLEQEADLVMQFSNQTLIDSLGDHVTQAEFFAIQDKNIARNIGDLLKKKNQEQETKTPGLDGEVHHAS